MFMLDNSLKLILGFFMMVSLTTAMSAEEKLQVIVKKTDITNATQEIHSGDNTVKNAKKVPFSFLLNGMRQALTAELVKQELDSDVFWKNIEEKNLNETEEINFFRPYFNRFNIVMEKPAPVAPTPIEAPKAKDPADPGLIQTPAPAVKLASQEDQFLRSTFSYEFDEVKLKSLFSETLTNLPDVTIKTFYIIPDISITQEMNWMDVGVTKKENFSGVIVDSWKKWAETQFKNFTNIVVLEKDFTEKFEKMNPESVTLKWNSTIKKSEVFQDRKSARFEVNAQYVLVNTKTNQSLQAFDFPVQKREVPIFNLKELSSTLASLIYNLLNSQTAKLTSAFELNRASSTLSIVELQVTGRHGLYDITQINAFLAERFKEYAMLSELKSYSVDSSLISIKSTMNPEALYTILGKDGGKFVLNEQKILLFSPENKTFAIIPKEANN
jgi:hypothetical protein